MFSVQITVQQSQSEMYVNHVYCGSIAAGVISAVSKLLRVIEKLGLISVGMRNTAVFVSVFVVEKLKCWF